MKAPLAAFALGAAAIASPGLAQQQNDYEAGVAARQAGDPARAEALLDRWIAAHPADADALVQRGYARLARGDRRGAQDDFRATLAIAPEYADARDGLARAQSADTDRPPATLALEGAWSDLSGGARDWREVTLDGETSVSTSTHIGGRANWYERFGREDVELVGRIGLHPSRDIWLRAFAGGTPNADFRPELEAGLGMDYRVAPGANPTVLTFDASYQRFPLQDVVTINPGVVQYFAGGKAWATLRGIGTVADGGPLQVGALGRVDYAPRDRSRIYAGIANGPDTDLGIVTRVTSFFGGGEIPLADTFALTGGLSHEWRQGGAERTEVRVGVKAAF